MKILCLRILNINSLAGENTIDFTKQPLLDAGLFAITGATGAGKSTILDGITLALYGRIPRVAEKISPNVIDEHKLVMTHNTTECYAQIDYETPNGQYRSTWKISRNKNGNLRDLEMTIATLPNERYLDCKPSQVPDENQKIIGLSYDQFVKSIILAQGEFAKFIKSDAKDRAALLEDITGSIIFREIGKKVFEKTKALEQEKNLLTEKISMIHILSDEEKKEVENNQINAKLEAENNQLLLAQITKQIENVEKYTITQTKLQNASLQLEAIAQKENIWQESFFQLHKHNALVPYIESINKWYDVNKSLQVNRGLQTEYHDKKNEIQHKIAILLLEMSKLTQTNVTTLNWQDEVNAFVRNWDKLVAELKVIVEQGKELRKQWDKQITDARNTLYNDLHTLSDTKAIHVIITKRLHDLQTYLSDYDEEIIQLHIESTNAQILDLHAKRNIFEQYTAASKLYDQLMNSLKKLQQELAANKELHQSQQLMVTTLQNQLEGLQQEQKRKIKIVNMEEYRRDLAENEACPLCGSTEHPYKDHVTLSIGEEQIKISTIEEQLASLNNNVQIHLQKLTKNETEIVNTEERLAEIKSQTTQWVIENPELSEWVDSNDIEQKLHKLTSDVKKYKEKILSASEFHYLQTLKEINESLSFCLLQYATKNAEINNVYKGDNLHQISDDLIKSLQLLMNEEVKLSTNLDTLATTIEIDSTTVEELHKTLLPNLLDLGYQSIDMAKINILPLEKVLEIQKTRQTLNEEKLVVVNLIGQLEIDKSDLLPLINGLPPLQILKEEMSNTNAIITGNIHTMGALNAQITQNNKNEQEKQELEALGKEIFYAYEKWKLMDQMIGDKNGNKFSKYAQNISLQYLIQLTNRRLISLTDRYLLDYSDIDNDMNVIDRYQAETIRSVRTLSGGETFLLSLALALSLSDMASQNIKLQSLFIDEGFGTLDEETLEMAMVTLEKIQQEDNRKVGIISHIESIKDRISTQIKITKNGRGRSKIHVV